MDIFSLIGKLVLSLGGAGAIICFFASHIAKCWSDTYIEKTKSVYEKELAEIKQGYEKELTEIKSRFDNLSYMSNFQYEKEFKIYQDIWSSLIECDNAFKTNYSLIKIRDKDDSFRIDRENNKKFSDTYVKFMLEIRKNEPFYNDSIYTDLHMLCAYYGNKLKSNELYLISGYKTHDYINWTLSENKFVYTDNIIKKIKIEIKDYMNNLKIKY